MPNGTKSCFADTNLLVYVADPEAAEKRLLVRDCLEQIIRHHTLVLSPQSLNECYRVVTEKRDLLARNDAQRFIRAWLRYCSAPYDFGVTERAWRIQDRHGFGWWDSMLLASATLAQCDLFLSEDMRHGQVIERMTILNPFQLDPATLISR